MIASETVIMTKLTMMQSEPLGMESADDVNNAFSESFFRLLHLSGWSMLYWCCSPLSLSFHYSLVDRVVWMTTSGLTGKLFDSHTCQKCIGNVAKNHLYICPNAYLTDK